jgi:hypothetical protein
LTYLTQTYLTPHSILRVPVAPGDAAPDQEGLVALAVWLGRSGIEKRGSPSRT